MFRLGKVAGTFLSCSELAYIPRLVETHRSKNFFLQSKKILLCVITRREDVPPRQGGGILLIVFGIVMGVRWHAKKKNTGKSIPHLLPLTQDTTITSEYVTFNQMPKIISDSDFEKRMHTYNSLYVSMKEFRNPTDVIGQDGLPVPDEKITVFPLHCLTTFNGKPFGIYATINGNIIFISEDERFFIDEGRRFRQIDIKQYLEQAASAQPQKECWTSKFQAGTHKSR